MDGVPNSALESNSGAEPGAQSVPANMEIPGQGMPQFGTGALAYPPPQYLHPQAAAQQEQLRQFWQNQMQEIHQVGTDPAEFKNHQLPLARIKKIMKSDEDVRMISAEAPVLFARACEMFILELTLRSWNHSEENKRRTLQRNDIAAAITRTDIFDFLVDIVPRDERGDDPVPMGAPRPAQGVPPATSPVTAGNAAPPPLSGGMPTGMWQPGGQGQGQTASEQGVNLMGVGQPQPQSQGGQQAQGQMDPVLMLSNLYGMQHQFQQRQGQLPGDQQPSEGQQIQGVPSYSTNQQQQAKQE